MNALCTSYSGWKNCLRLANSEVELIATLDAGPRIIRFGFCGGQNEFTEFPEQAGLSGEHSFHPYGGHRFWVAPEVQGWTNHPDNAPVEWEEHANSIILTAPVEDGTKLQKQIAIHLDAKRNHVQIIHTITNFSTTKLKLAPWAVSIMAPGGKLIVPQEPFTPHSKSNSPARPLVLWSYTEMQDPRWLWGNRFIQLKQDSSINTVQKFGACITQGWAAYANADHVFIKRFPHRTHAAYPDFGCNGEFFTNKRMLEMGSLGPLVTLKPEESISHQEDWYLFQDILLGGHENDIDHALGGIVEQCTMMKET
jgi:hypothetical protein